MAAPTIAGTPTTAATTADATNLDISYPSGIQAGEDLCCLLSIDQDTPDPSISGFTRKGLVRVSNTGGTTNLAVFHKIASGSESGTVNIVFGGGASDGGKAIMFRVAGSDGSTSPLFSICASSVSEGTAPVAPGFVLADGVAYRVVAFVCYDSSSAQISSNPSGYTTLQYNEGGGGVGQGAAHNAITGDGSTTYGDEAWTIGTECWAAASIAFREAATAIQVTPSALDDASALDASTGSKTAPAGASALDDAATLDASTGSKTAPAGASALDGASTLDASTSIKDAPAGASALDIGETLDPSLLVRAVGAFPSALDDAGTLDAVTVVIQGAEVTVTPEALDDASALDASTSTKAAPAGASALDLGETLDASTSTKAAPAGASALDLGETLDAVAVILGAQIVIGSSALDIASILDPSTASRSAPAGASALDIALSIEAPAMLRIVQVAPSALDDAGTLDPSAITVQTQVVVNPSALDLAGTLDASTASRAAVLVPLDLLHVHLIESTPAGRLLSVNPGTSTHAAILDAVRVFFGVEVKADTPVYILESRIASVAGEDRFVRVSESRII